MCYLCDKLQHISCIGSQVEDDARFACNKCEPFKNAHENFDKETPNIDDAVIGFIQNRKQFPTDNVEIVEEMNETNNNEFTTT